MGKSYRKYDKSKLAKDEPTYITWKSMKARCNNPNAKGYENYGGRGIKICDRWQESYENFLEDMGTRPPNTTLDRINNDGNYEPSNCRWATKKDQSNNRRSNHIVTYKGKNVTIAQLAEKLGIDRRPMRSVLKNCKWNAELAVQHLAKRNAMIGDVRK
ncbi:hypothetical protein WKH82_08340 [Acinetobacter baumannii]